MRLTIRTLNNKLVLCDEDGNVLPMQSETTLACAVDDCSRFTVTFLVTGDVQFQPELEAKHK